MNVFISQNFYKTFVKTGLLCNTQLCNRLNKWFIHYVILLIYIYYVCVFVCSLLRYCLYVLSRVRVAGHSHVPSMYYKPTDSINKLYD